LSKAPLPFALGILVDHLWGFQLIFFINFKRLFLEFSTDYLQKIQGSTLGNSVGSF
jgi:hypothetical protein